MAQAQKLPTVSSFHLYVIDMALKLLIDAVPYAMSYDVHGFQWIWDICAIT